MKRIFGLICFILVITIFMMGTSNEKGEGTERVISHVTDQQILLIASQYQVNHKLLAEIAEMDQSTTTEEVESWAKDLFEYRGNRNIALLMSKRKMAKNPHISSTKIKEFQNQIQRSIEYYGIQNKKQVVN